MQLLPKQVRFLWFLGAACKGQNLEHVGKSASISRLGDEDGTAHKKNQKRDPEAHSGYDVSQLKADVLLNVGHAP